MFNYQFSKTYDLKNHESLQVHFGGSKPGLSMWTYYRKHYDYPLPRIDDQANKIAQYKFFSYIISKMLTTKFPFLNHRINILLLKLLGDYTSINVYQLVLKMEYLAFKGK